MFSYVSMWFINNCIRRYPLSSKMESTSLHKMWTESMIQNWRLQKRKTF